MSSTPKFTAPRVLASSPTAGARPLLALLVALAFVLATAQAQDAPTREITNIAGDLYRFQNNFHFSVFYVTPDGIIVTDPIDADAATWLEAELAERFSVPVRYLVYSHDHADHISGGEVFADGGAVVVAHENARSDIIGENRPTAVPDITFTDALTLELGGKSVELRFVGRNHSDNTVVMHFPAERALFAVDFIPTGNTLPFMTLNDSFFPDWIDSLAAVEAMDFDILVPGHGALGDKGDVSAMKGYLQDLYDAVVAQARAGASLEDTVEAVTLDAYSDWGQYETWLPLNVEGVYQRVQLQRIGGP